MHETGTEISVCPCCTCYAPAGRRQLHSNSSDPLAFQHFRCAQTALTHPRASYSGRQPRPRRRKPPATCKFAPMPPLPALPQLGLEGMLADHMQVSEEGVTTSPCPHLDMGMLVRSVGVGPPSKVGSVLPFALPPRTPAAHEHTSTTPAGRLAGGRGAVERTQCRNPGPRQLQAAADTTPPSRLCRREHQQLCDRGW